MDKPSITREKVKTLFETKFIKLFDLQYREGKHYFCATRRGLDTLSALKSDEEFKTMDADAVTYIVIIKTPDAEPRLFLQDEFRYPTGQFLLSPPAGLMDPEDKASGNPLYSVTKREIFEETGIAMKETDTFRVVSPLVFSTPGMTDESNALTLAVVELDDLSCINHNGTVGSECFDKVSLLTVEEAKAILKDGRDTHGNFFSVYTEFALLYFISGLWQE